MDWGGGGREGAKEGDEGFVDDGDGLGVGEGLEEMGEGEGGEGEGFGKVGEESPKHESIRE